MKTPALTYNLASTRRLLALPPVTLQTVRQPGLDATIVKRNGYREFHITHRPLPGERPLLWSWRLDSFLREHAAVIARQDVFGTADGCAEVRRRLGRLTKANWPITCLATAPYSDSNIAGMHMLAISGAPLKTVVVDGHPIARVFSDGWARHCVLGDLRPRACDATRSSQAAQVYQELEDALARAGFTLPDIVRTWLFIDNILDWYKDFNEVRTEIFTQNGLFSHLVPASTGIGAGNLHGAALVAGAWAIQPLDGSGLNISEVLSPLQCSARKYGSCFSRAVAVSAAGLDRLLVSGTASIDQSGRSAHAGDVRRQIRLTMEVVEAILRSRGMRWTDVSRATIYVRNLTDAPRFDEWCAMHDVRLPALIVQADICRDELLFEIEIDAMTIRQEDS